MSNIPLIDLKVQYQSIKNEVKHAIDDVLESMQIFPGRNIQPFEEEFADYCGVPYSVAVGSGTEALRLALLACDIGAGDEVITVSHTFIATVAAISLTGATPVFVDIDPRTYTIDVSQVSDKINERTKAILPVHLYGQPADMDGLTRIAKQHGLKIIEDAAQAHGTAYKGKKCGSIGDVGCFSFYCTKNLGAYGEAGIITTKDDEIAEKIKILRDHGRVSKDEHSVFGYNSRIDEIQAAILRVKLKKLDEWNDLRRQCALQYSKLLSETDVITPYEAPNAYHVYYVYVIRSKKRDELRSWLAKQGIGSAIHYPIPAHLQEACRMYGYPKGCLPVTEKVANEVLSLPMYPELLEEQINEIANQIRAFQQQM
ncbi:DegT/DnrJ/EryC1/StrS family aminotransferase [Candidatus Poribacteria bacterium]|nr:DegT/DnrJ/EryC1/StrS family aminotransferase [Candidatus Poribacteria bacterium]